MNDLPLLFVAELLVFIGVVKDLALAFFQILVAGGTMSLELQVRACFGIVVCHLACCFGLVPEIEDLNASPRGWYILYMVEEEQAVCPRFAFCTLQPLPSYQAVQDNHNGPLELHYLLIK
jgi:hypothetical protein